MTTLAQRLKVLERKLELRPDAARNDVVHLGGRDDLAPLSVLTERVPAEGLYREHLPSSSRTLCRSILDSGVEPEPQSMCTGPPGLPMAYGMKVAPWRRQYVCHKDLRNILREPRTPFRDLAICGMLCRAFIRRAG